MVFTTFEELIDALIRANRPYEVIGTGEAGVVVVPSLRGRSYVSLGHNILNTVGMDAIAERPDQGTLDNFLRPGGSVLWPGPEGGPFGFHYAAKGNPGREWRVPQGLMEADFRVGEVGSNSIDVYASVPLINNAGGEIQTNFMRGIAFCREGNSITLKTVESIVCTGTRNIDENVRLVAWQKTKVDNNEGCYVAIPCGPRYLPDGELPFWHMAYADKEYDPRCVVGGEYIMRTDGDEECQVGIYERAPSMRFHSPADSLTIEVRARPPCKGYKYIDISDRPHTEELLGKGTRFSVCHKGGPKGVTEIEVVAACNCPLEEGDVSGTTTFTEYTVG